MAYRSSEKKSLSPELHILNASVKHVYYLINERSDRADSVQYTGHSSQKNKETSYHQRDESSTTSSKAAQPSRSVPQRGKHLNFDVNKLLFLAAHHKLRPVLLAYDKEYEVLPAEARQQLEAIHQRQVMRNLKLTQVFLEVSRLLNDHGIDVLPMKGNLLIHTMYGNQQLRETGDVDILLRRSDVKRAVEVLKQLDFRLRPDMNPQAHKYQDDLVDMLVNSPHQSELPLSRGSDHLDVHWSAAQPYYGLQFSTDDAFNCARPGDFFNTNVLLPAPEDALMLTLIHHGGKEHWRSLRHLLDFALLINSDVDIPKIRERARQIGVLKTFDAGCQLLKDFGLWHDHLRTSSRMDTKYLTLIKASWEETITKTARDQWFVNFPLRMRGKNPNQGIMKSFITVVLAKIDNQKVVQYPNSFGIKAFTQKALNLMQKLLTGNDRRN